MDVARRRVTPTNKESSNMGIMDNAKDMLGKAKDATDQAKDLADQHADKLPGDMGDKAQEMADKAADIADKIPWRHPRHGRRRVTPPPTKSKRTQIPVVPPTGICRVLSPSPLFCVTSPWATHVHVTQIL